ncbi:LLM class flavin-dependent oxidoreductase [Streptomyces sp. MT29]|nr:LLM class flavin-dependent oxidoreductase [Streptomyces sp. MT29]
MPSPTLTPSPAVAVLLPRDLPTDLILPFARRAEELGFGSVWVVEDLGFRGGITQAAAVLASTSRIRVGIGLLPAGARNVAFAAMEIASLAQLFPGRTDIGVGHGMPGWMRSVGQWPGSPLTFLHEYIDALRALLRGEGPGGPGAVRAPRRRPAGARRAADVVPGILAGVRGPKSLAVSGEVADGTILAEPVAPEYVRAALGQIAATRPHRPSRTTSAPSARSRGGPGGGAARAGVDRRAGVARPHRPAPVRRGAGGAAGGVRDPGGVRPPPARCLGRAPLGHGNAGGGPRPPRRARGAGVTDAVLAPVGPDPLGALESLAGVV